MRIREIGTSQNSGLSEVAHHDRVNGSGFDPARGICKIAISCLKIARKSALATHHQLRNDKVHADRGTRATTTLVRVSLRQVHWTSFAYLNSCKITESRSLVRDMRHIRPNRGMLELAQIAANDSAKR